MSSASVAAAESETRIPGQIDIWYFVLFEVIVFSSYFAAYVVYRALEPASFLQSQALLSQHFGALNTVILLISSWLIASAVRNAREHHRGTAQWQIALTIACGLLFLLSKGFEWSLKIDAGYTLSTDRFFSFYYFLTGIHVLHVLFGFVFLGVALYQLRRAQPALPVVESCAIYWHMVDFLWVIIFALLYVMR